MPWSTRAVLMLAIAVHFMPVSEGLTRSRIDPTRILLGDGSCVVALLVAPAAEVMTPPSWMIAGVSDEGPSLHCDAIGASERVWSPREAIGFSVRQNAPPRSA